MNQPSTPPTLSRENWQKYRCNLPRHLIGLARYMQSRLMHSLIEERGYGDLRLHYEPCMTLVGKYGMRLSRLADALAISRQATSQVVNQIEKAGYLQRRADPEDGRARHVVVTARGKQLLADGADLLGGVQQEFAGIVGEDALDLFNRRLGQLYRALGFQVPEIATGGAAFGWLLPRISDKLMRELMELTRNRGHPGLKMSYGQVLTLMTPEGGRIQEMARINEVSKQAISAIAGELEGLGYLSRHADPADARQVILGFTAAGVRLLEDSIAANAALDQRFAKALGRRGLAQIKQSAEALYQALSLETEFFGHGGEAIDDLAEDLVKSLGNRNARLLAQHIIEATGTAT